MKRFQILFFESEYVTKFEYENLKNPKLIEINPIKIANVQSCLYQKFKKENSQKSTTNEKLSTIKIKSLK